MPASADGCPGEHDPGAATKDRDVSNQRDDSLQDVVPSSQPDDDMEYEQVG